VTDFHTGFIRPPVTHGRMPMLTTREARVDQFRGQIARLSRELAIGAEGSMSVDNIEKLGARIGVLSRGYGEFVGGGE
jgi:hypothetical protein